MVRTTKGTKEKSSRLDLSKIPGGKPLADTVVMTVEFMKYQGEVAYEIAKKQAIATTSTASTVGIGWSAFFFGIVQGSWLTSSLGLMLVFAGTYLLAYWTPRVLDRIRRRLEDSSAEKFLSKWLPNDANSEPAD